MKSINNYHDQIKGILHGFDRIIFKGHLRQFFSPSGQSHFLSKEDVLLKDYSAYAQSITSQIKEHAHEMAKSLGRPYIYLNFQIDNLERVQELFNGFVERKLSRTFDAIDFEDNYILWMRKMGIL